MTGFKTGVNDSITIDQVIASAKADLGMLDSNAYDVHLEKWINEGAGQISSYHQFTKKDTLLTINNNRAELPSGYIRYLGMRFHTTVTVYNPDGSTTEKKACAPLLYIDKDFLSECNCDMHWQDWWINYQPSFQIVGNEIIMTKGVPDGTEVQFSYVSKVLGDDCLYIIHPDYERALSAYSRMKFLQAFPETKGNVAMALLGEAKREWINQRARIRGLATLNEFEDKRYQIINLAKAWFVRQKTH